MNFMEAYLAVLAEEEKKKKPDFAKDTPKDDDGEGMDPVGKEDGDVDNDGDKDESDVYLKKRRDTVKKAISKDDEKGDKVEEATQQKARKGDQLGKKDEPGKGDKLEKSKYEKLGNQGHEQGRWEEDPTTAAKMKAKACYENVEVVEARGDVFDAFVDGEFVTGIDMSKLEEAYAEISESQKDPNRADRDVLGPDAQGEKDFVDTHKTDVKDGAADEAGKPEVGVKSQAKTNPGDKRSSEPMKKVKESADNWLARAAKGLTR